MDTRRTRGVRAAGAFTLIELLVVIAIISVLTAIFLPVVNTARERGQQVSCTHVLKHMMAGFMSYAQENNQHYPPYVIGSLPYSSGTNFLKWQHLLGPYLGLPAGDQGGSESASSQPVSSAEPSESSGAVARPASLMLKTSPSSAERTVINQSRIAGQP